MPRTGINVDHNLTKGMKVVERLEKHTDEAADDIAKTIGRTFMRESSRKMAKNGSVVTGEGIRRLRLVNLGEGRKGVAGPMHLKYLDRGTSAHWPDTSNRRFIAAARKYNMDKYNLARTIARKGTQPHPWINEAFNKTKKTSRKRAKIHLDKAIQKSTS